VARPKAFKGLGLKPYEAIRDEAWVLIRPLRAPIKLVHHALKVLGLKRALQGPSVCPSQGPELRPSPKAIDGLYRAP
jgi:hypothetical protein